MATPISSSLAPLPSVSQNDMRGVERDRAGGGTADQEIPNGMIERLFVLGLSGSVASFSI